MQETLELAIERIKEINKENKLQENFQKYFETVGDFLLLLEDTCSIIMYQFAHFSHEM